MNTASAAQPQYGSRAPTTGTPTPPEHYTACEYGYVQDGRPTACTNRAIMMPGYKRACADHILHVLRESLAQYANREAFMHDDQRTRETVLALLRTL